MNIPVQNGQLPQGFCPSDYQTILNAFSAQQFVQINQTSGLIISASPPGSDQHNSAWLQLDSSGRPVRIYYFQNGAWLSPHPQVPGATMLWTSALPDFTTFDGGDSVSPPYSSVTGAMWQLAASALDGTGTQIMAGRVPLGVGALPSGATVTLGQTGGEDKHTLLPAEQGNITGSCVTHVEAAGSDHAVLGQLTLNGIILDSNNLGPTPIPLAGSPSAHNVLNPYYGQYYLQRTARLFYVVNA